MPTESVGIDVADSSTLQSLLHGMIPISEASHTTTSYETSGSAGTRMFQKLPGVSGKGPSMTSTFVLHYCYQGEEH